MATGTAKWFSQTKGYGFIQPDQGGKDVFVHISAVERSGMNGLAEGMKVTYDVEADRKSGKELETSFHKGGLIRGMSDGGRRASVRRPPLRITRTKMSLPCCFRHLPWNPAPQRRRRCA